MQDKDSTLERAFDQQQAFSNQSNNQLGNVPYYAQDIKRSIDLVNFKLDILMKRLDSILSDEDTATSSAGDLK